MKESSHNKGFGLVEVIVSLAIAAVLTVSFLSLVVYAEKVSRKNIDTLRANMYLTEYVEIVKDFENTSWSTLNINTCEAPNNCYIKLNSTETGWIISSGEESLDSGKYTRYLNIEEVHRTQSTFPNEIIASGGVLDLNTKKATVTVYWKGTLGQQTEIIDTYVYKF